MVEPTVSARIPTADTVEFATAYAALLALLDSLPGDSAERPVVKALLNQMAAMVTNIYSH